MSRKPGSRSGVNACMTSKPVATAMIRRQAAAGKQKTKQKAEELVGAEALNDDDQ